MTKKVLVTYGDGYGPTVIRAAESVLRAVAPDLEISRGKIGADAYDNTSYALPPETIELIAQADAILSGPTMMKGIPERDPLVTIKKQMGLYLEYGEFFRLCDYMGTVDLDTVVLSPTVESTLNVYETESLDGVASEYYTSMDQLSKIFPRSIELAEMRRRRKVELVSDNTMYPIREKLIRSEFRKNYAASEFIVGDLSTKVATFRLAHDPQSVDTLLCDIHSATCIWGQNMGLIGGSGLMPRAFFGDKKSLYMASEVYPGEVAGRELNPTSAILSVAVMLLSFGEEEAYHQIVKAVREMYRIGRTTPDVGGKLNAEKFAEGVKKLVLPEMNS
ncbi:MAG: isocitrate/isopropylmalate family dehydrogenase [archaeon]|nr:isocitrate/isopropylmalate family dehydrogenase [archaeon]